MNLTKRNLVSAVVLIIYLVRVTHSARSPAEDHGIVVGGLWLDHYDVHIVSEIMNADILVHCKSGGDDLGQHTLQYSQDYTFKFRQKFDYSTVFRCEFQGEGKTIAFEVFNKHIAGSCGIHNHNDCYWAVFGDGFYFNKNWAPFPGNGWTKRVSW